MAPSGTDSKASTCGRQPHPGAPKIPSVDCFDPTELRCEVLRRAAQEASMRMGGLGGLGDFGRGAPPRPLTRSMEQGQAQAANGTPSPPPPQAQTADGTTIDSTPNAAPNGTPTAVPNAMLSATSPPSAPSTVPVLTRPASQTAAAAAVAQTTAAVSAPAGVATTPWQRALDLLRKNTHEWIREAKLSVFLAFNGDSLFRDPSVEELYQRHHMHQWSPRFEWSSVAWLQMFVWDLVANPRYRLSLICHFYVAFVALVTVHASLFMALRGPPRWWRISRGFLLCSFLVGRGIVCHPLFMSGIPDSDEQKTAWTVHAATSLIGIGMTNLSGVLALRLHTLDTLLLCVAHGFAWFWVTMTIPSGEGWQTLLAGHSLVAFVCVWQQHEQERFERSCFEEELLMERGMLLRSADCLVRRGTEADFGTNIRLLHRARVAEHIHF